MRKIFLGSICMLAVCIMILTSFKSPAPTDDKTRIEDYEFDSKDMAYDQSSGDFVEGIIPAVDTRTGLPVGLEICPGTGQRCTVWTWVGNHPTIYLAKKWPDGPIIIPHFFW
jgi:hypothetical protein